MIVVNGDSWTGGRMPPPTHYWVDYLSEIIAAPLVVNLAVAGSSNQRIFRTTLDFLHTTDEKITHLIIGWSAYERDELPTMATPTGTATDYYMLTPIFALCNSIPEDVRAALHKFYYKWCFNPVKNVKQTLLYVLTLQELCHYKGIRLINFFSFKDIEHTLLNDGELTKLVAKIDKSSWLSETMKESTKSYPSLPSGHTGPDGDRHWAEIIAKKIQS